MGTNKPRVQCILEEDMFKKFKEICNVEDRTESKMAAIMIKKYIAEYEKEKGRINNAELSE